MKIAAQLYTVRDFMKTPEDIRAGLQKIKQIGYNAAQVSGVAAIPPEQLRAFADEAGIELCASHIPFSDLQTKLDEVIATHKTWGTKYVGIGGLPGEYRKSGDGYVAFAKEASEIGKKLNEVGLQFIYHNHDFEFVKFDGRTGMDILFEESDKDAFHFELDVYWVQAGGADPIAWINKVNGRMKVVHFKDMKMLPEERKSYFAEVGEGNMNFPGIIAACKEIGVEWAPVEQDKCPADPFDSLQISFNNLIKLGAEA